MSTTKDKTPTALTKKDFTSDQAVRWCPGCGDYAILAQMQKVLPELGIAKENIVFVSGIGCSSRFPYYMDTYGLHTIHGRATTIASGLKVANPDLSVWVITGDGDGLSIGGNHLLHVLRRNVNLNIILFNNRIYGLTKGQYSPTSPPGHKTKSSPMGSIEQSLNPAAVAIAAKATFVARTLDRHVKHLGETLKQAAAHQGTSFVEVLQNCPIFNDNVWEPVSNTKTRSDNMLSLEHGKPMVFGKEVKKGIKLNGLKPEVVELNDEVTEDQMLVHDKEDEMLSILISRMHHPEHPIPLGVIRQVERPCYEHELIGQVKTAKEKKGNGDLKQLYHSADTWEVK